MSECLVSIDEKLKNYNKNQAIVKAFDLNVIDDDGLMKEKVKKLKNEVEYLEFCLKLLNEQDREIIEQSYFKNMSTRNLARMFCVSKSTIDYRKKQALKKLLNIFNS